jgi:Ca2+-binding EF-hand superfamily protein
VNINLNKDDIEQIFIAMDFDNSGQVDYTELIASFPDASLSKNEKFLRKEFETSSVSLPRRVSIRI